MIPDLSKTLAKATEAPSKKRKLTKVNEEPRSHKSDKVQEQALELLDATVKSVLPPKVNKKYPMKVVTEAYKNFEEAVGGREDRKSTRLNSSHSQISYAVFCLKKKKSQH